MDTQANLGSTTKFSRVDWAICLTGGFLIYWAMWASPVRHLSDSSFTLLTTDTILKKGTYRLDDYFAAFLAPGHPGPPRDTAYQLERTDGHIYFHYPPGTPYLTVPLWWVMQRFGHSVFRPIQKGGQPDQEYDWEGAHLLQGRLAAVLVGMMAATMYATGRIMLPRGWAVGLAIIFVFGTQLWSTASRVLWSHTWGVLLLFLVVDRLIRIEERAAPPRPILVATLLSWCYFCRPVFAFSILCVTVYYFIYHRRSFWWLGGTGAAWAIAFALWSWKYFETILPSYYTKNKISLIPIPESVLGNLISPSRGLFIYVPLVIVVVALCVHGWRQLPHKRLAWTAIAAIIATFWALGSWHHWWGGSSYGARLASDILPWFFLLALLGIHKLRTRILTESFRPSRLFVISATFLILLSIIINGRGAISDATWSWNSEPRWIEDTPERLWDWTDPQMLRGI